MAGFGGGGQMGGAIAFKYKQECRKQSGEKKKASRQQVRITRTTEWHEREKNNKKLLLNYQESQFTSLK